MKTRASLFSAILLALILIVGIFLRAYHPETDPPYHLDFSKGIDTDGPYYLNKSLAAVGGANIDPTLGENYDQPWINGYAYIYFRAFGHSLTQLTLFNLFPGMLSVVLLAYALFRAAGSKGALVGAWLGACNFPLVMFSRVPVIYIWLCVFCSVFPLLWDLPFAKSAGRRIAKLVTAVLVIVTALIFKPIVLFFLPCLILAEGIVQYGKHQSAQKRFFRMAAIFAVILLFALALLIFFTHLGPEYRRVFISFGYDFLDPSRLNHEIRRFWRVTGTFFFSKMPLECSLAYLACLAMAWTFLRKASLVGFLDIYYAIVFILGLAFIFPFAYSPFRYFLFLIPPAIYLTIRCIPYLKQAFSIQQPSRQTLAPILLSIAWFVPLVSLALQIPLDAAAPRHALGYMVGATLFLATIAGLLLEKGVRWALPLPHFSPGMKLTLPLLFGVMLTFSCLFPYWIWANRPITSWKHTREDLLQILPKEAVLTGPFAHLLAFDSSYKAFHISIVDYQKQAFVDEMMKHGVTHLVVDALDTAKLYRPFFDANPGGRLLNTVYIRGYEVQIWRLTPDLPAVRELAKTDFEQGLEYYEKNDFKHALALWEKANDDYPASSAAARALAQDAFHRNLPEAEQMEKLSLALSRNPDHPSMWLLLLHEAQASGNATAADQANRRIRQLTSFFH